MKTTGVVGVAVVDDMPIHELAIACEVFGTDRNDLANPWYQLRVCAADPGTTTTQNGFIPATRHDLTALAAVDTVIVPALPNRYPLSETNLDPRLIEALQAARAAGARIISLCTGAFALAEAGLLDGRRATTHWMYTDVLAAWYPAVQVDADVLYIDADDVMTSAGRTAGLDLCLHLVRKDLGVDVANQLARRMVAPAHRPGGQAQYIATAVPRTDHTGLAAVLHWATERLDQRLTIADMARRAGLSQRSLIRRFHDSTGTTPLRWLQARRLDKARTLLESTDLTIERVGELCGMGSAGNLRHHFTRAIGVTPTEYRRTFRGDLRVQPLNAARGSTV